MFWLLPLLGLGAGALVMTFWDKLRDTIHAWARARDFGRICRVVLRADTLISGLRYRIRTLVFGRKHPTAHTVVEEVVETSELPDEVRAALRSSAQTDLDVTEHVLEH